MFGALASIGCFIAHDVGGIAIAIAIAIAGKETGTRHKKIMRLIDVILMEAQRDPLNLPVSQLHASIA